MNNTTVKERVMQFITHKKISTSEFCRAIGVSSAFVSSMRKSIQPDKIKSIAFNYPELNVGWILTGEGEMLRNETKIIKPIPKLDFHETVVPLLPISARGGSFDDFIVSVREEDCEKIISPIRGVNFAIPVTGDSMAPNYPSGSQVLIKKINERAFIEWGKVYVLDTCNGTVIKRIMPEEDKEYIRCVSINPNYPPFTVCFSDVIGMYKVMMVMSLE